MFEAKLLKGLVFRKVLDAIKDLVNEASWECTSSGMSLQAMDISHVSLVAVDLNGAGFDKYRCDRNMNLGMNLVRYVFGGEVSSQVVQSFSVLLSSLAKVLKGAGNDDQITIRACEEEDRIKLIFNSPSRNLSVEIFLLNRLFFLPS